MEPQKTETQKPQYRTVKTRFGAVLNEAFAIFKKNAFAFMGLYTASIILGLLVTWAVGLVPIKGENVNIAIIIAVLVAIIVIRWMVQLLGMNTVLRGAWLTDNNKFSFGDAFTFGLGKIGKALGLSVRVFFYTGVWALLLVALLAFGGTILTFLGMSGGANALTPFTSILGPVTAFMPLVLIVLLIFMIGRICSAVFSFPILMARDTVSSKDALKESISLAKGFTGTVFSNYFIFGLITGIAAGILTAILAAIIKSVMPAPSGSISEIVTYSQNISTYAAIIPGIIVGSFGMVFQYAFMKKMVEEKADQGGWDFQGEMQEPPASSPLNPQPPAPVQPEKPAPPVIKMVE